jgi:hypothetical protein
MKKICSKCRVEKEINEFSVDKNTKSGFRSQCKKCLSKTYILNRNETLAKQKEKYNVDNKRQYYINNIIIYKERNKKYYKEKKDDILLKKKLNYNPEDKKKYYEKNKDKINKCKSLIISNKRKSDKIFKLKHNISCLIRNSLKKKGYIKSKKTELIVGCSISELIIHISSMFSEGMSIENHGEWHIDHIIPLAMGKTEDEVIRLNHYTNLQPLWAKDNLIKSCNYNETYGSKRES